jgi:lipopolysaccharide biosynthesis regulator YciM
MGGEMAAPVPGDSEAGIYTETLARLYLKQGFVDRALAIYRHLVQEQPDNHPLQMRLQALEQQVALAAVEQDTALSPPARRAIDQTSPMATRSQAHGLVVQLERWLHYLQRQRQPHAGIEHGQR